jgi:hypothetical protein
MDLWRMAVATRTAPAALRMTLGMKFWWWRKPAETLDAGRPPTDGESGPCGRISGWLWRVDGADLSDAEVAGMSMSRSSPKSSSIARQTPANSKALGGVGAEITIRAACRADSFNLQSASCFHFILTR